MRKRQHVFSQSCRFTTMTLKFCPIFYCFMLLTAFISAEIPNIEDIRTILHSNSTENITYDQLKVYFEKVTGIDSNIVADQPRLFPLCIQESTLEGFSSLAKFAPVWKAMEKANDCQTRPLRFYEYNESAHSMKGNDKWIETIEFTRINTKEVDVRNLRQWVHITVKAKKALKGLYMQPIVGAIGLSSGEFSLEFPCSDLGAPDKSPTESMLFHCDYRSRAELSHPLAFFGGFEGTKPMTEFHVHYKWTDISCLETPFMQFILIAIEDFKEGTTDGPEFGVDFQPLLSPVYTNIEFDSKDGVITPYYVDWEKEMTCMKTSQDLLWVLSSKLFHDTNFEAVKWKEATLDRLHANEDYEECVTGKSTGERDEYRKECGPGPFECPEELSIKFISDKKGFQEVVKRRQAEFDEVASMANCIPCFYPPMDELNCTGIQGTRSALEENPDGNSEGETVDTYLYLDYSEFLSSSFDSKVHGAIGMLVYIVILPVSILIARFYRGTPVHNLQRDDIWVVLHAGLHITAFTLMWISIGFVSTLHEGIDNYAQHCMVEAEALKYNTSIWKPEWTQERYLSWIQECTFESLSSAHSGVGMFAFIVHNITMFLSFFRSRSNYVRNIQVILHSHFGYCDYVLSILSIYFGVEGEHCSELLGYALVLVVTTAVGFLLAHVVTTAEDRALRIEPRRYRWPILEPIRFTGPGPYYECKIAVLSVYSGLLFFIWVLTVLALSRVSVSEAKVISGVERSSTIFGIFKTCHDAKFYRPRL